MAVLSQQKASASLENFQLLKVLVLVQTALHQQEEVAPVFAQMVIHTGFRVVIIKPNSFCLRNIGSIPKYSRYTLYSSGLASCNCSGEAKSMPLFLPRSQDYLEIHLMIDQVLSSPIVSNDKANSLL